MSVAVARWIGERAAQPHRYKYILSAKDRCMDPGADPGRNMEAAVLSFRGWSVCECLEKHGGLQGWIPGKLMLFTCAPTCAFERMSWVATLPRSCHAWQGHHLLMFTPCVCTACLCQMPAVLCAEAAGSGDHMCDCEGDLDDGVLDDRNGAPTSLPGTLLRTRTPLRYAALLCPGLLPSQAFGHCASVMP